MAGQAYSTAKTSTALRQTGNALGKNGGKGEFQLPKRSKVM